MSKQKLTPAEAVAKLHNDQTVAAEDVAVTGARVSTTDAVTLRAAGIPVQDAQIHDLHDYPEPDAEDEAEEWVPLTRVPVTLLLPAEVAAWAEVIPAGRVASELLTQFWRNRKLVE